MAQLKRYNGSSWEYVGGNAVPKTSKTTSDTDTYSCNYVNSKTTGTVLWTNSNPTSSFSAQTINNLSNLSQYVYIDIVYFVYKSNTKQCCQRHYYDTTYKNGELMSVFTHSSRGFVGSRQFVVNADSIEFKKSYSFTGGYANGSFAVAEDNDWTIPYKIIGYK